MLETASWTSRPHPERAHARPFRTIAGTYLATWLALSALFTVLGLVTLHVIVGDADWDAAVNRWLVARRTDAVDQLTGAATFVGNTLPVLAILAVSCLVLLALRRWWEALFLATALTYEVTVFLTVNLLVDRDRPDVDRLDSTPSTGSFPSGHVAASLTLWVGLAIVTSTFLRVGSLRAALFVSAVIVAATVAFARVYRGMHHLTDVLAGAALGVAALLAAALTVRVVSATVARRHRPPAVTRPLETAS